MGFWELALAVAVGLLPSQLIMIGFLWWEGAQKKKTPFSKEITETLPDLPSPANTRENRIQYEIKAAKSASLRQRLHVLVQTNASSSAIRRMAEKTADSY